MAKRKNKTSKQLDSIRAVRGIERKEHFSRGGDLVSWRGGPRTVTVDRKKQQNKRACRGKWQQ